MASTWLLRRNGCGSPANDNLPSFAPGLWTVLILVGLSLLGRLLVGICVPASSYQVTRD